MRISKDEVIYTAKLAKLCLTDEEAEKLAGELDAILADMGAMETIDMEDAGNDTEAGMPRGVIRPDENVVFGDRDKLFVNTKSMRGTFIQIPKVIE